MPKLKTLLPLLALITVLFFSLVWASQAAPKDVVPFSVTLQSDGNTEEIRYWQDEEENYFVFLPGYADVSNLQLCFTQSVSSLSINEKEITSDQALPELILNEALSLSYTVDDDVYEHTITFLRSENIASVHIDTSSGSMDYIHENKENEETGLIRVYTEDGEVNYDGKLESIHGRGNTTWRKYDKKPYSIKLQSKAELLGMDRAKKWVLLANAADPSNIRNKAVFEFAKESGLAYTPDAQWVDLYLNGEYAGLYLLCERIEVSDERVDIESRNGFLVSMELESRLTDQNYDYIKTENNQALRIHYPSIVMQPVAQRMQAMWQSVENAILAKDGIDPTTGKSWTELIDVDSWVRKYLLEEIFGNADGCYLSQYFYYDGNDPSGKIYAGPVWDYDLSTGCPTVWQLSYPQTFYSNRLNVMPNHDTPWFHSLYQKEEFRTRMVQIYQDEFLPLITETVETRYAEYSRFISDAALMNQIRWNLEEGIHASQLTAIQEYMTARIVFLNRVWIDNEPYYIVQADNRKRGNYAHYVVFEGQCLDFLPDLTTTQVDYFEGWYYVSNNQPVDVTKPVTQDLKIYAKWKLDPIDLVTRYYVLIPACVVIVTALTTFIILKRRKKRKLAAQNAVIVAETASNEPPPTDENESKNK